MPTKTRRPVITVTRDDDGGLTIHDPDTDLVVSLITTHPDANGPRGLHIEVYAYRGGEVMWQEATRPVCECDHAHALCLPDHHPEGWGELRFGIARHPTIAFYGANR